MRDLGAVLDHKEPCPIPHANGGPPYQALAGRYTLSISVTVVSRGISTIVDRSVSAVVGRSVSTVIGTSVSTVVGTSVSTVISGGVAAVVAIAGSGSVIPISRAVSVCVGSQTGDKGTGN
jgi:hypothetical protein